MQQQYDNIQKEIQETEGYSSALENKLISKQAQIDKTTTSLHTYEPVSYTHLEQQVIVHRLAVLDLHPAHPLGTDLEQMCIRDRLCT